LKSYIGKVAFVTGAAGGIGLAIATELGRRGMKVMLADLDSNRLSAARDHLAANGIVADFVVCDVADIKAVRRAAKATLDRFGKVHFVVNNAGVSLGGPTGEIAIEDWNWIVNINLMGVVHGVETFTPIMIEQGEGGHILNTASMAGHLALPGGGPYNATKYACVGYSETIRQELAPQGIGVSVLCPGWVKTAINETSKDRPTLRNGGADREETEQGKQIAAAIDAGLDPAVVAAWALSQIDKDRFYIFTHPELSPFVDGRFAEIKEDLEASRQIPELALQAAARQGTAPLDVLVIGAGFSGICAAIKLEQSGISNFAVYDKCDGIGGTWWLNTYPGATCDIPSHFYCYSFEMNPKWSRLFAPQPEIQAYIQHCAVKYGVRDRIHLGHEIQSVTFDDDLSLWVTRFSDGKTVQSRFVINGSGGLHAPFVPDFAGRDSFAGTQMHTARWDHSFDPAGKRIAVIGSAASAIQAVPKLAEIADQVTLFQRTPNYIAPRDDFAYSAADRLAFETTPQKMQALREEMFEDRDTRLYPIVINPLLRQAAAAEIKTYIRSQVTDPDVLEHLLPDYELGCKRILISDDFYPTLNRENVELETSGIAGITPSGIVSGAGNSREFDAIIYATGFDIEAHKLGLDLTGPGGVKLAELWKDRTDAYKAVMVPAMPNYFMVTGPNAGVGTTSVVYLIEQTVDWIVDMIKQAGRDKLVSVRPEACLRYSDALQSDLGGTVWASGCDSWYVAPNGRIETLFPGNARAFAEQMADIDLADFEIRAIPGRAGLPVPNWTERRGQTGQTPKDTRKLDPTIKAILSSPEVKTAPKMHEMSATDARLYYKAMVAKLEEPIAPACDVENHQMPLAGRGLNFRIYRPLGGAQNGAAMVYFHGGGWVIGDLDTHDKSCRAIANHSRIAVVSVDYRRAPEHRFPEPLDDGYDAFCWLAKRAADFGFDPKQIGIGGDSAGGNIASAVTLMLRDRQGPACAWQVLIYPSLAPYHETQSSVDFASGYGLDGEVQEWFAAQYFPKGTDFSDPRVSPLMARDLRNLPPAFIATAGFDPLRDAAAEYAEKLRGAGVPAAYVEYSDLIHGFKSWAGIVPSAKAALKDIAQNLSELARQTAPENEPA